MKTQLQNAYSYLRSLRHFIIRDELHSKVRVPPLRRVRFVSCGFLSQASVIYDLKTYPLSDYVSDFARIQMGRANSAKNSRAAYSAALNNKIFFSSVFQHYLRVPHCLAFIEHGKIHGLLPEWRTELRGVEAVLEMCKRAGAPLVFKPVAGAKGQEIFFLSIENGEVLLNGEATTEPDIHNRIKNLDEFIICEFLQQGEFASRLHPHTTNTMRMLTLIDPDNDEPFMPMAIQRIGTSASMPVDNWSAGGLSAEIDLDTGELGPGASCPSGRAAMRWHDTHPDTGAALRGQVIPGWREVRDDLLTIAQMLPFYKCIAWDIVIMEDGIGAIEANSTTDVDLLQIHRPLLRDERVRRFFTHHRVI